MTSPATHDAMSAPFVGGCPSLDRRTWLSACKGGDGDPAHLRHATRHRSPRPNSGQCPPHRHAGSSCWRALLTSGLSGPAGDAPQGSKRLLLINSARTDMQGHRLRRQRGRESLESFKHVIMAKA